MRASLLVSVALVCAALGAGGCRTAPPTRVVLPQHPSIRAVVAKELKPYAPGSVLIADRTAFPIKDVDCSGMAAPYYTSVVSAMTVASATRTAFAAVFVGGCDLSPKAGTDYVLRVTPDARVSISSYSGLYNQYATVDATVTVRVLDAGGTVLRQSTKTRHETISLLNPSQFDRMIVMALLDVARDVAGQNSAREGHL